MNGKQWTGFTKLCWLVLGVGALVSMFGWLAVALFAGVSVAVVLVLGAVAVSGRRQGAAGKDEALDAIMAEWREAR